MSSGALSPNGQIPALLSGAAAGISPQRGGVFGSLVFSMKVAEYVALGLPVICSGIATMRHYFSEDELLFFEPESAEDLARAIRDLLTDPAAAEERAARSRKRLDELDWPAQKQTLMETVEALAGSPWNRLPGAKEITKAWIRPLKQRCWLSASARSEARCWGSCARHTRRHGRDIEERPFHGVQVLHLCFPYTSDFVSSASRYVSIHEPGVVVVNSTVVPGTTREIADKTGVPPVTPGTRQACPDD